MSETHDEPLESDDDTVAGRPAVFRPWAAPARVSPRALRAARHFAEAFFATSEGPPPAERLDWMERELDDFLGRAGGRGRGTFRLALFAITWGAPLFVGRLGPLGRLAIADRVHALETFESIPGLGLALFLVRAIVSIVYYEHPDAARDIGWDQACLGAPVERAS